jgi:hypothetical protein
VACTRGGGLDPSPKAWEALLLGSIPIIQRNTLIDGYEHFPVLLIDNWHEFLTNPNINEFLEEHSKKLAPYFEKGSELRRKVLHVRISMNIQY